MKYIIYPSMDVWNYVLEGVVDRSDVVCRPLNSYCYTWQMVIRKLFVNSHVNYRLLFKPAFIRELEHLSSGDELIICDYLELCLLYAIADIAPSDVKKFFWIWNPIKLNQNARFETAFTIMRKLGFTPSTFDPSDARRYKLVLFSQFFRMNQPEISEETEYDFYFVGFEKGRRQVLDQLEKSLSGYKCFFKVVNDIKECISYEENILNIAKSKCLVDIVQEGQDGITLRPLEALAFKKKLITNNKKVRELDFYNPNNVFILGVDSMEKMEAFVHSDWADVDERIVKNHDVNSWVENFQ